MTTEFLLLSLSWKGAKISAHDFAKYRTLPLHYFEEPLRFFKGVSFKKYISSNPGWMLKVEREWEWLESDPTHQIIYQHDKDCYPEHFLELPDSPLGLCVKASGCFSFSKQKHRGFLGVVGGRSVGSQSLKWMDLFLSEYVAKTGVTLVSGGARGVDQRAHGCSLLNGQPTVVFLPSGLASLYPKELVNWQDAVLEAGGALVSQFSPFEVMYKSHFHGRNRLIACLSEKLLVVEARRRSGTLLTARYATEMEREVGVIPTHPMGVSSRGGLDLLINGATPICDVDDLLVFYPGQGRKRVEQNVSLNSVGHP